MEAKVLRIAPWTLEGVENCTDGVKQAAYENWE